MKIILAAIVALLAAQPALAQRRANKPYNTVNGRTATGTASGGGFVAAAPAGAGTPITLAPASPQMAARSFSGGRGVTRGSSSRGARSIWGGPKPPKQEPEPSTEEAPPPGYSKPGALIRTTGQEPKYTAAPDKIHTNTVDAGEIVMNDRKAFHVAQAPGLQQGPKDTPPPPNPTRDRFYGGGASANDRYRAGSGGGGGDNNGGGNNGKDKPGDDDDGKGKDKTFNDPTGFNAAF